MNTAQFVYYYTQLRITTSLKYYYPGLIAELPIGAQRHCKE